MLFYTMASSSRLCANNNIEYECRLQVTVELSTDWKRDIPTFEKQMSPTSEPSKCLCVLVSHCFEREKKTKTEMIPIDVAAETLLFRNSSQGNQTISIKRIE